MFTKSVSKFCYQNSVTKIMLANSVMHSNEGIQGTLHTAKRDEGAESHLSFFSQQEQDMYMEALLSPMRRHNRKPSVYQDGWACTRISTSTRAPGGHT